jgi:hypothetical protein
MLRPAKVLALLDWSDLELCSGRRGRLPPSLPRASHLDPESDITTQPCWGRTVTGLPLAGALSLQAARSVAKFIVTSCYLRSQIPGRQILARLCPLGDVSWGQKKFDTVFTEDRLPLS